MPRTIKPSRIRLETSSYCQLRCPSCPNTSQATWTTIGRGFLSLPHFQSFLATHPWIKDIELANYGEIFLNPELLEILKHAAQQGVRLRADTGTNLNYAASDVLEGLVKYKLQSLTCSIDGASQESYSQYRLRGNFQQVLENIRTINRFKQQHSSLYPLLTWQFVVFGHNEHELPVARQLARELHMQFRPKLSWDSDFSPVRNTSRVRNYIGQQTTSRHEFTHRHKIDYMDRLCHELWEEPQINWDGKILGCSRNFWGDFGGNAFTDGLVESLNTEKLNDAREMLLGKREMRPDIPCSRCDVFLTRQAQGKHLRRGLRRILYRGGQRVNRLLNTYCRQSWRQRMHT